jgi:hypothetical protein
VDKESYDRLHLSAIVDVTDKLPRKMEAVADSLTKPGTKTTILYEYDPNIKVEPPAM